MDSKPKNKFKAGITFNIKRVINGKVVRISVFAMIQLLIFILFGSLLIEYLAIYSIATPLILILIYLTILNSDKNSGYKIIWISLFSAFPIFGMMLYFSQHSDIISMKLKNKIKLAQNVAELQTSGGSENLKLLHSADEDAFLISNYLTKYGIYPPETNTRLEYFSVGEKKYQVLKEKLKNAKEYIYLEYFIIKKGILFSEILDILAQKSKEGLDIRIMYDEFGVMGANGERFKQELEELGIKVKVFNPVSRILSISLNNRNHRKIAIIDGKFGFIGGINMADEYVNINSPHGHWKDSAIMLEGNAVYSLNTMFLSMWDSLDETQSNFSNYDIPREQGAFCPELGFVQPYFDNSFDAEPLSENLYINIISKAKKYVRITTPYLIPTDELMRALKIAAQSGIEISIITPFIQDKKYIKLVNQSYYPALINSGVKIYEYLPGFLHAKMMSSDDKFATIGSVNFDYRSFYLNLEAGCFIYKNPIIKDINNDIDEIISKSKLITMEDIGKQNIFRRLSQSILRTFAPLM